MIGGFPVNTRHVSETRPKENWGNISHKLWQTLKKRMYLSPLSTPLQKRFLFLISWEQYNILVSPPQKKHYIFFLEVYWFKQVLH